MPAPGTWMRSMRKDAVTIFNRLIFLTTLANGPLFSIR